MVSFGLRSLVPVSLVLAGCGFFTLDEPENAPKSMATGGSGGSTGGSGGSTGGTGGSTGGSGGSTGGTGGSTGGAAGSPTGGAGSTSTGGMAGSAAGSAGDTSMGGTAGSGGSASGGAGVGGDGAGSGGAGAGGAAGSGNSGPCGAINAQAQAFAGHCYYRNSTPVTWSAARAACMALSAGGHLVTITSQEEQDFVWGLATMMDAWIGATDGLMDNQGGNGTASAWITGEDISQYNGWASGEPNNYQKDCPGGGTCFEHCGFMWVDTQGKWNDDVCGYEKSYICEWDTGG
jgi:hypothetical protein